MVKITLLKVQLSCEKCKKKVLKSVSGLQGVDKIEIDAAKGTLKITGDADPYEIILKTRKAVKCVEVVTIGPPPAPPKKEEEKKQPEKKPDNKVVACPCPYVHMPHNCMACQQMAMVHMTQEPCTVCSIM